MNWWKRFLEESSYLRHYLWKYRRLAGLGLLALIIVDGLEIVPALILKEAVDSLQKPDPLHSVLFFSSVYFGVALIQSLCRYSWRAFLVRSSMLAGKDIRQKYSDFLFSISTRFYDRRRTGDLISLATNDTESIRMALGGGMVILADAVFYFLTIPVAMVILSPKLTLLAFLPLPIIPLWVLRQEREIHRRFEKVQESFSQLSAAAQENLMGIRVVKGFARENTQLERFAKLGKKYISRSLYLSRIQSVFGPDLDFIMSTGLITLIYFGGGDVIQGSVTLGTFVAFQKFIQRMIWPMEAIGLSIAFYQRAVVSSNRLKEVQAEKSEVQEPRQKSERLMGDFHSKGVIEFKNLSFSYTNAQGKTLTTEPVLKNISFLAESGQKIAFVGLIGSGKSTLLSLIPRLYSVEAGKIFIDGIDINQWPLETLRNQIGFVSQDGFLFSDSVLENVAFGLTQEPLTASNKQSHIEDAATIACVHQEVLGFSESYQTRLGERGINVSGGQRQRLTIARALARQSPILILDDSLAAVDIETEKKILSNLIKKTKSRTDLIAAHRLSCVQEADKIYVLHKGEFVQSGKHSDLVKQKGSIYYNFFEQQKLQAEFLNYTHKIEESLKQEATHATTK